MNFQAATGLTQHLCFAVFGALTARHISDDPRIIAAGAFAAIILSIAGTFGMAGFLHATSPLEARAQGFAGAWAAVNTGFMLLVPFTVLAVAAELALGWNAVQVFTSAGIMTAGATIGTELARAGKRSVIQGLLPSAAAFTLSALWMILGLAARALAG